MNLEEAQSELEKAREAYDQARRGTRISKGDRTVSTASVEELRRDVEYWERRVAELKARARGTTNGYSVVKFQ